MPNLRLDRYSGGTALQALDRSLSAAYSLGYVIQVIIMGVPKNAGGHLARLGFHL